MMDWYGNFPPPSRDEATLEVQLLIQRIRTGEHYELCKEIVYAMPSLGSYTGWHVSFKNDAVTMVLTKLDLNLKNSLNDSV